MISDTMNFTMTIFFSNHTSPTATYTLSLHDALPIWVSGVAVTADHRLAVSACADGTVKVWDLSTGQAVRTLEGHTDSVSGDRKSTRLNSSHVEISYAVFCLKKKRSRVLMAFVLTTLE